MSDVATQCMQAVIGAIKQNPDLLFYEAGDIVDSFYPGEGGWRLTLYVQAMYDVASISENTYDALRAKIIELSLEDLGRIMPQVRIVADELLKPYLETARLQARKAELQTLLAGPSPVKTEPDVEAMEFWNAMSPEVMEWQMAEAEYMDVCNRLGE